MSSPLAVDVERPLAIDLYAGLGGWTDGLMAEGYECVGFDIERHEYAYHGAVHRYPAQLVLQDVLTIHGRRFRDAALIVASPPCQEYSYMAMPFTRGKQIARALSGDGEFPENYGGSRTVTELTALFDACFRIQREACAAAGRHIPMVVENVCGAQQWVGPAKWHYGSYYLWGDVPALMPMTMKAAKVPGQDWNRFRETGEVSRFNAESERATKNSGGSWFRDGTSSKSTARKAASARIAKIPTTLARWIGHVYFPRSTERASA